MKHFILAKVHSCSVSNDPKDLEKGLGFIVVVESTKKIGELTVPDFIKCKSSIKVENGEHLFEVDIFNIGGQGGVKPQTYYRIKAKAELARGK